MTGGPGARGVGVCDLLLDALLEAGIDHVFSSPGSEWAPLWEALARRAGGTPGVTFYNCRHEALALSLSLGYTKVSGKPSAQILHASTGPLAAALQLRAATMEEVPVVVLVGDTATYLDVEGKSQWLRAVVDVGGPARLLDPLVKWSSSAMSLDALPATIQHAVRVATATPAGPVVVGVDVELLAGSVPRDRVLPAPAPLAPRLADPDGIDRVARALAAGRHPLVITEEAGRDPAAVPLLVALAERLAVPVAEASAPAYLNFPRDHPLHVGYEARAYAEGADVILLLGAHAPWHPTPLAARDDLEVFAVGTDPGMATAPIWPYPADLALDCDAVTFLHQVLAALDDVELDAARIAGRAAGCEREHDRLRASWQAEVRELGGQQPLDARWVVARIAESLPSEPVVVTEAVTIEKTLLRHLPLSRPGSYFARKTAGLGVGLGAAIGAKVANPHDFVVAFLGDGAFNYNPVLAAYGFLDEYDLAILTVVFSNGYAGMRRALVSNFPGGRAWESGETFATEISPPPDYHGLSGVFDLVGRVAHDADTLKAGLDECVEAVRGGTPALLEVRIGDGHIEQLRDVAPGTGGGERGR